MATRCYRTIRLIGGLILGHPALLWAGLEGGVVTSGFMTIRSSGCSPAITSVKCSDGTCSLLRNEGFKHHLPPNEFLEYLVESAESQKSR